MPNILVLYKDTNPVNILRPETLKSVHRGGAYFQHKRRKKLKFLRLSKFQSVICHVKKKCALGPKNLENVMDFFYHKIFGRFVSAFVASFGVSNVRNESDYFSSKIKLNLCTY